MLLETVDHGPRAGPAAGGVHAAVLRLRGARRGGTAPGVRGDPPRDRRRRSCGAGRWCRWPGSRARPWRRRRRSAGCSSCAGSGRRPAVARDPQDRSRLRGTRRPRPTRPPAVPSVARPAGPVDPETPFMVIYTSGTTGAPKGTVHVHGGFPVKAAQDLAHTFDLRPGDALCWITDLGWMMGPWAISGALLLGARLVLFEGAPDHPDAGPGLAAGRAPPDHPPRDLADADPGPAGPRRRAGAGGRPVVAPGPGLDRRAVEPRSVVVAVPGRRRRPRADRQLHRRDGDLGRDPGRDRRSARSGRPRSTGRASGWPRTSSTRRARRWWTRSASWRSARRGRA